MVSVGFEPRTSQLRDLRSNGLTHLTTAPHIRSAMFSQFPGWWKEKQCYGERRRTTTPDTIDRPHSYPTTQKQWPGTNNYWRYVMQYTVKLFKHISHSALYIIMWTLMFPVWQVLVATKFYHFLKLKFSQYPSIHTNTSPSLQTCHGRLAWKTSRCACTLGGSRFWLVESTFFGDHVSLRLHREFSLKFNLSN